MNTSSNSEELQLVFDTLKKDADKMAHPFYIALISNAPELVEMFSDSTVEKDMFCEVIKILDTPPSEKILIDLGRMHKAIPVLKKKHFHLFSLVIFSIIRNYYNNLLNSDIIKELDTRIDYVVDYMREGFLYY